MDRSRWLTNVLDAVAQFASSEFQRSAWVEFAGPEGASFEEASELLDDSQLGESLASEPDPYQLRPDERRVLREFWETLDHYSKGVYLERVKKPGENYASPERVISQPEWQRVRETALAVLKLFKEEGFPNMPKLPIFDRNDVKVLKGFWEV